MSYDHWKTGGDNPGREWEREPYTPKPIRCGCTGWADWDERRGRFICDACQVSYDRIGFRMDAPQPAPKVESENADTFTLTRR